MTIKVCFLLFIIFYSVTAYSQDGEGNIPAPSQEYEWPKEIDVRNKLYQWQDLKFGMFIHYGLYTYEGSVVNGSQQGSSWAISNQAWADKGRHDLAGADYKKYYFDLINEFNPSQIDPDFLASLGKKAGMKYLVFTSKHHDGFNLFDTKQSNFSIANGPLKDHEHKNLMKSLFNSFRSQGFWLGVYYSCPDWNNQDYWCDDFNWGGMTGLNYNKDDYPEKFKNFVDFTNRQVDEIMGGEYGDVDILWFDIPRKDWEIETKATIARGYQSDVLLVQRGIKGQYENYTTPEQGIPAIQLPYPWESCITLGKKWSYVPSDEANFKSATEVIHLLAEIVAKGGNLLLGFSPKADGTMPSSIVERLEQIGDWMNQNGEAIYNTRNAAIYADKSNKTWFTQSRDGLTSYAIVCLDEGGYKERTVAWKGNEPISGTEVKYVPTGELVSWEKLSDNSIQITLPDGITTNTPALVFSFNRNHSPVHFMDFEDGINNRFEVQNSILEVVDNPVVGGLNTSNKVLKLSNATSSGSLVLNLISNLSEDQHILLRKSNYNSLRFKYYSTVASTKVRCKLDNKIIVNSIVQPSGVSGKWEIVEISFDDPLQNYDSILFELNNSLSASHEDVIYVDDLEFYTYQRPTVFFDFEEGFLHSRFRPNGSTLTIVDNPDKDELNVSDKVLMLSNATSSGMLMVDLITNQSSNNIIDLRNLGHNRLRFKYYSTVTGTKISFSPNGSGQFTPVNTLEDQPGCWEWVELDLIPFLSSPLNGILLRLNGRSGASTSDVIYVDDLEFYTVKEEPLSFFDFETGVLHKRFRPNGSTLTVVDNPQKEGLNKSDKVLKLSDATPSGMINFDLLNNQDVGEALDIKALGYDRLRFKYFSTVSGTSITFNPDGKGDATAMHSLCNQPNNWEWVELDFAPYLSKQITGFVLRLNRRAGASASDVIYIDDFEFYSSSSSGVNKKQMDVSKSFELKNRVLTLIANEQVEEFSVNLFDLRGIKVAELYNATVVGKEEIIIDNTFSGFYVLQIVRGTTSETIKAIFN